MNNLETHWSDEARLTFDRLPVETQAALIKQFPAFVAKYAALWANRTAETTAVG
jgi:hypothetical protein